MKKMIALASILMLQFQFVFGQSLIQNDSFENGVCPTFASQMDTIVFWNNPTLSSPEYYHQWQIKRVKSSNPM
jgi:hypothetical protein